MNRCAVFTANRGYALSNSRGGLIGRLLSRGWRVVIATADDDESRSLQVMGAELEPVRIFRSGLRVTGDFRTYRRLAAIYEKHSPTLIHHFHAKPVILGSMAARRLHRGSPRVVNTITGLGHAFIGNGLSARLAGWGYRAALPRADITVFQNLDDRRLFLDRNWVRHDQARLITSSGVDPQRFPFVDRRHRDPAVPVVAMIGRLLRQKGIAEFAEVARRTRRHWPGARFLLAGEEDPVHPDAVTADRVAGLEGLEYIGHLSDVRPLLSEADLLLFPSYYREGAPRVVLEAAATGLPTVAFDVPGVREVVRHGETGYLVPFRDVPQLAVRVAGLLEDPCSRRKMGHAARRMVEASFDVRAIEEGYLEIYRELGVEV